MWPRCNERNLFLEGTNLLSLVWHGKFFFSCERPSIVMGNFFSRVNDPRLLREIFFLVRTPFDCYGKFFFSCERPSIVTGNFFSRVNDPRLLREFFFSRANDPRLLREIFFLVRTTLGCYGKFFFSCERPSVVTGIFFSRATL